MIRQKPPRLKQGGRRDRIGDVTEAIPPRKNDCFEPAFLTFREKCAPRVDPAKVCERWSERGFGKDKDANLYGQIEFCCEGAVFV
jgi:hypothetical protein